MLAGGIVAGSFAIAPTVVEYSLRPSDPYPESSAEPQPGYTPPPPSPLPIPVVPDFEPVFADLQKSIEELEAAVDTLETIGNTDGRRDDPLARLLGIDNEIVSYALMVQTPCSVLPVSDNNAYYCSFDDRIYISSWVTTLPYGAQLAVYAHEDGHSEDPNYFTNDTFAGEQYADSYAGFRLAALLREGKISAQDYEDGRNLFASLGSTDHGTPGQRVAAFDRGAQW